MSGPDQAVGWLVALACFFINFILAGLARSAGVLYVALIELYGVSREAASTPFSLRVCVRNMSGPLIGLLGQKYGIRRVTTLGGFVAGFGGILCYFAPNVTYITIFWGIIHGLGFGLSSVIHMLIINQYFDKYKASALGLGYSGDCFGSFVFPVLIESLLKAYDIRGTFLIIGGIVLNVIPLALILKTPPWVKSKGNFQRNILEEHERNVVLCDRNGKGVENQAFKSSNESITILSEMHRTDEAPFSNSQRMYRPYFSNQSCNWKKATEPIQESKERHNSMPPLFEQGSFSSGQHNIRESEINSIEESEKNNTIDEDDLHKDDITHVIKNRTTSNLSQIAYDIVHRVRTASFASQVAQDGFIAFINQEEDNCKCADHPTNAECCKPTMDDAEQAKAVEQRSTSSVFNTLLRVNSRPIFILISMTVAVYSFLFVGTFTVIIDYATDYGISEDDAKYLIVGFSITDLIGRLSFGQVIDRKLLKLKNYAGMTMVLMGASIAVMPFNRSFSFMMICMCACGLIQAGTAIMFPILITHYMDKNEGSIALGCSNFYGGLLMLPLSSMIGYFRDNTGSYDMVFYLQGFIVVVVGLVWQLEPLIIRFPNKSPTAVSDL